jgi:Metallo-peptidase family M12B Reprolysin-like/Bacterial Ig-like domain (group 1)
MDALNNLSSGVGVFGPVQSTLRDRYGADIVVLVRPFNYPVQESCGSAWVGGSEGNGAAIGSQSNNGFAVVSDGGDVNGSEFFCQNATFPHELGHNMGALHDRQTVIGQSGTLDVGAYPYSYGYVHNATWNAARGQNVCSGSPCFGTIMSYLSTVSELKFSNPALFTCPAGLVCGTSTTNEALTLNNTRLGVASWRPTKVPFAGVQRGSGQSAMVNAPFAQALQVTIRDATNLVVSGVTVTFAVPGAGASATLSAASAVTDANGVAQVTASANGSPGSYTVVATAASGMVANPFTFSLTNAGNQAANLDVDSNGRYDALTDGLVILRYLFGLTGSSLTNGALGPGASRVDPAAIAAFLKSITPQLDVDGNGQADALTDGVLILRYLLGLRGDALLQGAIGTGATRTTAPQIESYLAGLVH